MGVTPESTAATFSNGVVIPEYVYICFQMTFACITPALIVGGFAERMKFSALMLFIALWVTFVYFPIAHMVWYWAGPDAIGRCRQEVAEASGAAKAEAEAALAAVRPTPASSSSGAPSISPAARSCTSTRASPALVGAFMLGKRVGYRKEPMPPHSLTLTCIGAALLWVGWFGFNAGSNLEATGTAALAMINTFVATAPPACPGWSSSGSFKWQGRRCSACVSGAVAGLVAVTPAAGFAGPMGAHRARRGGRRRLPRSSARPSRTLLGYDDSLDVFGIHCIGGIVGALGTGLLVSPEYGGTGMLDYVVKPGTAVVAEYVRDVQLMAQLKAVALTLVWSGIGTAIISRSSTC